jgi:hypothetical protein
MTAHPTLFPPNHAETVTPGDTRMPGTSDAPCHCGLERCEWPFRMSCWPINDEEDE